MHFKSNRFQFVVCLCELFANIRLYPACLGRTERVWEEQSVPDPERSVARVPRRAAETHHREHVLHPATVSGAPSRTELLHFVPRLSVVSFYQSPLMVLLGVFSAFLLTGLM